MEAKLEISIVNDEYVCDFQGRNLPTDGMAVMFTTIVETVANYYKKADSYERALAILITGVKKIWNIKIF